MGTSETVAVAGFSPGERDYLRRELDMFFSTLPRVADGFFLRTWRAGPQAGQPKRPPAVADLLERGLLRLDATLRPPRVFFTETGLAALRTMMADRRLADPVKFAHVRQELGLKPEPSAPHESSAPAPAKALSGKVAHPPARPGPRKPASGGKLCRLRT